MLERKIEARLKWEVENLGGLALKFTSPGMSGVPDRLVLLPAGRVAFVELKAPGKKLRPLQQKRKKQIESLGFKVYVIDSYRAIDLFVQEVMK
ncbi:hypothetical protein GGQ84_001379 [Desulfitispora alkaliphila]|uniref:VRR-NUC domain-containing protein n=1 Tax=Desulfitispora alkaliphila TaxID=622674 RepID=UPI003D1DCD42